MSGKKPILAMAQGIPRIHASSPTEVLAKSESTRPGSYQQFFGDYPTPPLDASHITVDPKLLKQQEAERTSNLNEITVDKPGNKLFDPHQSAKASLSIGSRVINLPNLTTDRTSQYPRTCTKSVHKVVFLFCSVALAIIIACIIFVEMKKMQMDEREY